jgi:hypothetical protein
MDEEQIYGLSTDPYMDEDHLWKIGVLWMSADGNMGNGTVTLPNYFAAELLQKHFRRNVTPLNPQQLQHLIETAQKGIMQ